MSDSDPPATFSYLAEALSALGLAYLHVFEPISGGGAPAPGLTRVTPIVRRAFRGALIVNGGYDAQSANAAIESGAADLVAFGVPFLANPDLPERLRRGAPLNKPDTTTFYAGEEKGYVDYPTL
jgi:N-ethylmaleimide reductase